jgi:hypothetical protein
VHKAGGLTVSHKEFAGTVNSTTIKVGGTDPETNAKIPQRPLKLPINPGDARTFPWLNGVALRFEKYRFTMLKFHYYPTCSTLESGGVSLCPIYDPADPVPTNRSGLLNAEGVVRGAVHNELCLTIPQNRMRRTDTMFVRNTHEGLSDPNELRLSDLGYLAVSLSDSSLNVNLGDIFVEYTIELSSPRVGPRIGKCGHYRRENFFQRDNSEPAYAAPFGNQVTETSRDNHSAGSTVMFDVGSDVGTYYHLDEGSPIETNTVTFHEPFTGFLHYQHSQSGDRGDDNLQINGGLDGKQWGLVDNKEHKTSWGVADIVSTVKDKVGQASQLWKVAVNAGETLEIARGAVGDGVMGFADMLFTDAAPALLALL